MVPNLASESKQANSDQREQASAAKLGALGNWLSESDAISDYAEAASDYRARIGVSNTPASGADYLRDLLAIARSLV